ncbi:hypothetical protein LVJ94_13370 [Pendulispora rubella]|uniref:TolB protein n=1 Tax=Pendulispora rubella TaxID=2741070 RepID=A0ABZ2LGF2_9BACT
MTRRLSLALLLALLAIMAVAWVPGCGSNDGNEFEDRNPDGSLPDGGDPGGGFGDSGGGGGGGNGTDGDFSITPRDQTIDVAIDQEKVTVAPATLKFQGKWRDQDVVASWSLDRGELGVVDNNGVFTPANTFARAMSGVVRVTGRYQRDRLYQASTAVTVRLHITQNGKPADPNGHGVGGVPIGGTVDNATKARLKGTPTNAPDLIGLYPYDGTVWPRGLFAPLLQWQSAHPAKAVYIHLKENGFEYEGFSSGTNLVNQPIWQAIWDKATYGNSGDPKDLLTLEIRIDDGAKTYGTITRSWTIAPGALKGTVYYNSYNTKLADAPTNGNSAGVIAIRPGQNQPVLAFPENKNKCFVCHTVSDDGSTLFAQYGVEGNDSTGRLNYANGRSYDLRNGQRIADYPGDQASNVANNRKFLWSGVYKDGSFALQSSRHTQEFYDGDTHVFRRDNGQPVAASGIDGVITEAVTPAFSPDGKKVAFNQWTGGPGAGNGYSLSMMDFACGAGGGGTGPSCGSLAFSGLTTLYTSPVREDRKGFLGWPAWLPDSTGLVFHNVIKRPDGSDSPLATWKNAEAQISFVGTNKVFNALRNLNGANPNGSERYLPTNDLHKNDERLNYEPTVNPIPSGGYYWVVFTSRRMYGNVAPGNPYEVGNGSAPVPKKLWVAAIDINRTDGKDPSHPAFYLPAQELNAGNLRGYWVVDPCKKNGNSCATGDECCNGFCRQNDQGALVCTDKPQGCAQEYENCEKDSDCCGAGAGYVCINNRCARKVN